MYDVRVFGSYLAKLAKENLAKLIMYVVGAILAIGLIKWLVFGGIGLIFSGILSLFGMGPQDDKELIKEQAVAITQLENANRTNSGTIEALQKSKENAELAITENFEKKEESNKKFAAIEQKGHKAFIKATKSSNSTKVGVGSSKGNNASEDDPDDAEKLAKLEDPQSPESLELAAAQYEMVTDAYCAAVNEVCN